MTAVMDEENIDNHVPLGPASETPVNAPTTTRPSSTTQSSQAVIWKYFSRTTIKEAQLEKTQSSRTLKKNSARLESDINICAP